LPATGIVVGECPSESGHRLPDRFYSWLGAPFRLLEVEQRPLVSGEVARVQNLYPRIVVSVERRWCARTPGIGRVCGVGKPDPEVVQLDRDRGDAWVQDESFIIEDPSHVYDTVAIFIGCQVALVPGRDEGCNRSVDDKQREGGVWRKARHFNVHVLNWSQIAERNPSTSCGFEAGYRSCGLNHVEGNAFACSCVCERHYAGQTGGDSYGYC
jgi:hypothetical protein